MALRKARLESARLFKSIEPLAQALALERQIKFGLAHILK
jgi:hypothetical protein